MEKMYRLMIVDDEKIVREAISEHIAWEDYGITMAKAAPNAIEALRFLDEQDVDLILLDIRLPVMDGLEFLKKIREAKKKTDVIILSGYADFSYAQTAMRYGVKDYLLKPLEENNLIDVVKKYRDQKWNKELLDEMKLEPNVSETYYSKTVKQMMMLVEENIANEEFSLKYISAKKLFLNENYLGKIFQKEVKCRFSAYLLERRMRLAMQLLAKNQDILIGDVAQQTGFGDNSQYFSTVFKKYTGYTPTEYKRKIREAQEKT